MSVFSDILGQLIARLNPAPSLVPISKPSGQGAMVAHHREYSIIQESGPRVFTPAHTHDSLDGIASWLVREAEKGRWDPGFCDVLVSNSMVQAISDPYRARPASALCRLSKHFYWRGWLKLSEGGWIPSEDLYEAIRELEPSFSVDTFKKVDGTDGEIPVGDSVLRGLRAIGVSAEGAASVERDAGGMALVTSKSGKQTTSVELRERWPLRVPVFDAAPDLTVDTEALVSWRRMDDDLVFRVRIPLRAIVEIEARALVVERLRDLMPGFLVGDGTVLQVADRLD